MRFIQIDVSDKYQDFFNFMNQEHDLILTIEEMDEIVFEAQRLIEKFNTPALKHSDDMCFHECPYCNYRCNCSNQPCSCCNEN